MTPADRAFWLRAQRRVAGMLPDVQRDLLRSYGIIRASLNETEVTELIRTGALDRLVAEVLSNQTLDRAFLPFRSRLHATVERGFKYVTTELPRAGRVDGELAVLFDHLNPRVLDAIRDLESGILATLKTDVREVVREAVRLGLEDGVAPRTIARRIPDVIGLGKAQLEQIATYRDELTAGRSVTRYTLRNPIVDRLLAKGPLTPDQVDRYTEAYRKARLASNTEGVTRTAALNAYKGGQDLSWRDAVDAAIVPGDRLRKTWIQIQRPTRRDEHIPLNGETVGFFEPYSNGSQIPGDQGEPNCGCISRVFVE